MKEIATYLFKEKKYLLVGLLSVLSVCGYSQNNYYVSPSGNNSNDGLSPATAKLSIPNTVAAAINGDIIHIANGTYSLTATLYLDHELTIIGETESGVIINATGTPGSAWAINANKSNTSLSNLTILPNSTTGGFPIHVSANTGTPLPVLSNINLNHITIIGALKTAFDFNGLDNLTVSYLTAKNTSNGNGIQFSGCKNVNATHLTTSGNAWGGIAVYVSKLSPAGVGRGSDNVVIDAAGSSLGETTPVYIQDESGFVNTNTIIPGLDYLVRNTNSVGFTFYYASKTTALAIAALLPGATVHNPELSTVKQVSTGNFIIGAGIKIQTAINAANTGDIINIDPGTYTERLTIPKPLTLQGSDETTCILSGTGLAGTGTGIRINSGITNVTIQNITIQNFTGSNGNTDAGIYAVLGNNNLTIKHVTIQNNVGGSGLYGGGPVDNVILDYVTSSGHTIGARGIVIWNGLKSHITITNCKVFGNNCCGIELQDGSASGVIMSNNNVYNNGDNGISAVGLDGTIGSNLISNNTLSNNGRFGIELKNPNGSTTVSSNIVSNITFSSETRDGAGIAVYRRGVLGTNVDVPTGVKVLNNIISGYKQPSASEGFGLVVEGTNHTVTGNTVTGCDVGIQQQSGNLPYPADGDQSNLADTYFGRGNAQIACGNFIGGNIFNSNGIDTRNTGNVGGSGFITNTTTGKTFCSIQAAINDLQTLAGHTLELTAGVFNEQVLVNKSVIIRGVGASQPVINFTGTPSGKPTVFDVSVANVTIENLNIKVDQTKLLSGIIASGVNISNLTIKNNIIEAYASSGAATAGSYGDRNAVSINYTGSTNYRIGGSGGVNNILFKGNTVSGVANDGFGKSRFFRSGISTDESGGNFSNNTVQSINHDILVRFGSNGNISITNNILNGGGVELADMNVGAGTLTVSGNNFNGAFANVSAPGSAILRLRNNYNSKTTLVTNNTFNSHEWAVSMENYNSVTIDNNSFTPLAGSATYHHITVNTKSISSNSSDIVQKAIGAILTNNTFNGSGATGGSAVSFYNHDNDAASFGTFTIGTPGNENNFNQGIGKFIELDNQSGSSSSSAFPAYTSVIGAGAKAITTMGPWAISLDAVNNKLDAGNGLSLPAAMPLADLFSLEDKIQHKIDAATLGFVTVKSNNNYVTLNSFLAPVTGTASVQRGVDAAVNGYTVNISAGTFADNILINKEVHIKGQGQSATKIVPAVSNPNCGGSGGGSLCAGGSNVILVQANNVTVDQLTIDGDNPSLTSAVIIGGADIDARNGIITNHNAGIFNNLDVNHVAVRNIFLRGIYASSGGTFSFADNTVSNIKADPSSVAMFNFGGSGSFTNNTVSNANDAIASNWSKGTTYSGNTVTNSGSGIHTDNNGGRGGNADQIQNNQVSNSPAGGYGIWIFAPFRSALVKDNTVSNVEVGLAHFGQQAAVTPIFSGNTIDGQNKANSTGVYITTSLIDFGSSDVSVSLENNLIKNNTDGFYLESEASHALVLAAHNNSISGNMNSNVTQGAGAAGAGTFAADMECNWWGTAANAGITATINATAVDYTPWLSNGVDTDLPASGFQPALGICASAVSNAQVTATTNVLCFGSSNGSATISFENGFGSLAYSLDGGAKVPVAGSPFTINGLSAGIHTVTITDGGGNTVSVNVTIAGPAAIAANFTFTPILCNGGLSTQNVTITGGTAPYTLTNQNGGVFISGAQTGVTYGGNAGNTYAANYTYTVTDKNGCQYVFTENITQPSVLNVSSLASNITCNGSSTIIITANGGKAPYNGTGTFNVTAGTYTYTVTDANRCTATTTITPQVIADVIPPTISAPLPVNTSADAGACIATNVNLGIPAANDNCSIASISNNAPASFAVGTTYVTWKVTDNNGNSATAVQIVVVNDTEKPKIKAPGAYSVINDAGKCEATLDDIGTPVTSDNCGILSVTNNHPSHKYPVGTTTVTWTVTDNHGNITDTAKQTITVIDNELPTITVANVTVSNSQGICGATVNLDTPQTGDNCGVASITNNHPSSFFPTGTTNVTWTVTDNNGLTQMAVQTVTVLDKEKPEIITAVANQSFCINISGNYTLPVLMAKDNCNAVSVSYIITGATARAANNANNASGVFNPGVSTIAWTVSDAAGNQMTSTTQVTVNPLPTVTIAASNADAFCNKLTLIANSSIGGASYSWTSGSSTFSAGTQQISLGQSNADGFYIVTVTVNSCTSLPAKYNFIKQSLINSYTILAFDEVSLGENNTVSSGSVGVTSAWGEAEFHKNSSVASAGSFVKAKYIDKDGSNITISNPVNSAATGITLPTMLYNTANTNGLPNAKVNQNVTTTLSGNYKNLILKKGSNTILMGNIFGTIRVEQGAQVKFTSATLNIDKLQVVKGPRNGYSYVSFAPNTNVLISSSVAIGSQVYINPDNYKVTFYMSDKKNDDERFTIKGGDTKVTANIYLPNGKLRVTGGYRYGDYGNGFGDCDKDDDDDKYYGQGNSYVYMTGLFIAEKVEGNGKNVIWNSFDCSAGPAVINHNTAPVTQISSLETTLTEEELKVTVMPNPSTTFFTLKLESKYATPVNMRVMDAGGRVVDAKSNIGSNSIIQMGNAYSSGTYYAEMIQGTKRKVVQLIKGTVIN